MNRSVQIMLSLIFISMFSRGQGSKFLALGDSYTIGERVSHAKNWPNQFADSIQLKGIVFDSVQIIAQTGWRTDNLMDAIQSKNLPSDYDLVSLLIGVNNQYQGKSIDVYKQQYEQLLQTAIAHAGGNKDRVIVLSIPDYAYTPFGDGDTGISSEIDQYNAVKKQITGQYAVSFYDITGISRQGLQRPELVASDGLHPSALQYSEWVSLILGDFNLEILQRVAARQDGKYHHPGLVYPNPANSFLSIKAPVPAGVFSVFSISGTLQFHGSLQENQTISLKNLVPGMYILKLVFMDGSVQKHLFMKK